MNTSIKHDTMFGEELAVVASSRQALAERGRPGGDLSAAYASLLDDYERLLRMSRKIAAISDAQGLMLKRREHDIRNLLDHANQGFLTFGRSLTVDKMYSRECVLIYGRKIAGLGVEHLLWPEDEEARRLGRELLGRLFDADSDYSLVEGLPSRIRIAGKTVEAAYKWIHAGSSSLAQSVMVILTDVTERLDSLDRVQYLSSHDPLTGLYNRYHIEQLLERGPAGGRLPCSLLVIDLNGLKLANDMFGHRAGDRLLIQTAELLRRELGDEAVLARWGGDEFIAILPHTAEAAAAAAASLRAACEAAPAEPVRLSMAIGFAEAASGEALYAAFGAAEKMMYKHKLLESKQVRVSLMKGVSDALLSRGFEESARRDDLLDLVLRFARHQGVAPDSPDMKLLPMLVQLHDAGNLGLPHHILRKPGPLSEDEWEIVKSHSEIGYRMAQSVGEWALAEAILGMHERWDGSGYPYGLSGKQIPFLSRLMAVVDAYDAMTHERVFKPQLSSEQAADVIAASAGSQFDPELARAFRAWIPLNRRQRTGSAAGGAES